MAESSGAQLAADALDESYWQELRQLFPIFRRARYFAACSQGPLSTRVEAAVSRFMDSWREMGNPWEAEWIPVVNSTAEKFARLVGAPAGSVGVTASVSAATSTILSALDFGYRRKVVTSALEFPTIPDILLAYRRKGLIDLEVLQEHGGEIPLDAYERAIDDRTALVCVSSVSYATGAVLPTREVCALAHARGALCLVDAYQSVGALVCDVQSMAPDFLVTGTLKYLLGTSGVGLIYVAPDLAERLEPRTTGWMASANPFAVNFDDLEYAVGGARFQGGTFSIPGCYAADASLDLLLDIGAARIEERVLRLSRRFVDGLAALNVHPTGPTSSTKLGPMVAVPVTGSALDWQERLRREEGIVTSARGQALRFAFHFYNDDADVDRCLAVVDNYLNR